jgi:hypothetical protein
MLFTHTLDTTIFNEYLIFTKKTGGTLQLIDKQLEVMRGQLIWKYTVPRNLRKVEKFLELLTCARDRSKRDKNSTAV